MARFVILGLGLLCTAQVSWWVVFFIQESLRTQDLIWAIQQNKVSVELVAGMAERLTRHRTMIVAEGLVFLSVVVMASWYVLKIHRRELRKLQVEQLFLRSLAHELKTPIAGMGLGLSALERAPERSTQVIAIMRTELDRLTKLVEHALVTALRLGKQDSPAVGLSEGVEAWFQEVKIQQPELAQNIEVRTDSNSLQVDSAALSMALYCCWDNSRKFAPTLGGLRVLVQVRGKVVEFWDNGPGLPNPLVDQFKRQHTEVPGQGLGLYLVQQMMTGLGGRLSVIPSSPLNPLPGAGFRFEFP